LHFRKPVNGGGGKCKRVKGREWEGRAHQLHSKIIPKSLAKLAKGENIRWGEKQPVQFHLKKKVGMEQKNCSEGILTLILKERGVCIGG